jgi:hypothetical protein
MACSDDNHHHHHHHQYNSHHHHHHHHHQLYNPIFSFSVLWEILTREEPFAEYNSFDKFREAVCVRHERPAIPDDCLPSLK